MHRILLLTAATTAAALSPLSNACAQVDGGTSQPVETVVVTAQRLANARNGIQTQTGASTYTITSKDIEAEPGGENTLLNQVILQAPGVAQDSFGQLHIRGEHNGLQYRLNGIIIPEGISVFGQTLDPRLADSVKLIDGALPAEYGDRTAGIIDVQSKTGLFEPGGQVGIYGGSHGQIAPSFDYGGSSGGFNYFVSGDYTTDTLGIESPDGSADPLHDRTKQWHGFAFLQDILDRNSSVTAILGTSNDMFEIPNSRGLEPAGIDGVTGLGPDGVLQANGQSAFLSNDLDGRQREITITASSATCIRKTRSTSRCRCSDAIRACTTRPARRSGSCSTTASPRPPTSATRPTACRPKAPGTPAKATRCASASSIRPTISPATRLRWCCWSTAPATKPRTRRSPSPTTAPSMPGATASISRTSGSCSRR